MSAPRLQPLAAAVVLLSACARLHPQTGLTLSRDLDSAAAGARARWVARDTAGALRLLTAATDRAARAPERDLVHGHVGALGSEMAAVGDLAALRAAAGDTAGARAAFERLLFEGGFEELRDSLERSPLYAALGALPGAAVWRERLRAASRWRGDSAFATPFRDTLPVAERVAGVSLLWAEVRYGFVESGRAGAVDWDSVYQATLTRVMAPMDTWAYYRELERFLAAVGDDHTGVVELPAPLRRHRAGVPLEARLVEGQVIVTRVRSPSLRALGVAEGQEVLAIDGLSPEAFAAQRPDPPPLPVTPQARDAYLYSWQLWLGEAGSTILLRLRDPDGREHDVSVRRGGWTDAVRQPSVEWRRLEGGIGYLALNTFGDPTAIARIDSAFAALGEIRGLVVDTRLNSGGSQDAGWHVLARFLTEPYVQDRQYSAAYVGIWRAWGGSTLRVPMPERILLPDGARHRSYPVLWLIGPRTASAAEGVAALAEQTGVATTVGEATFGSTGQPLLIALPGGGRARIRTEEERYNDGRTYTRRGIVPQVPVRVTAAGLRAGRDEVLEEAVRILVERVGTPGR